MLRTKVVEEELYTLCASKMFALRFYGFHGS
jgi:hypothetical protein